MGLFTTYSYLKKNRLSDVVRLISVLAIENKWTFRNSDGLNKTLNGKPKSAKEWFDVAQEHPEFFKFNTEGNAIVLLIRFLNRTTEENQEKYPPLTIDQAQKLVDQAILLHDKQISRFQRNSFLIPILTAIIAALATGLVSFFTINSSNANIKNVERKIDEIDKKIDQINVVNQKLVNDTSKYIQKSSFSRH